jgi:hypothetical protein
MTVIKGLIFGFLCLVLLCGANPVWADEDASGTSTDSVGLAEKESKGPSKRGPAGRSQIHHPDHPVQLPNTTGPIVTDSAITQPFKTWSAQITPTINVIGGVFNSNWQRRSTGADQPTRQLQIADEGDYKSFQVSAQLNYGLTPRMDISLTVPFRQNWASNVGPFSRAANFGSLGDSSLALRYMFLNGSPTATTVTGYASVLIPNGHASPMEPKLLGIDQTGGGAFGFTWGIDVFKYVPQGPILLYANIWYTNFVDGWVNGTRVYYPDQFTVNLAMEVPFKNSPSNRWAFLLEVLSNWDAGRMFGPKANQAPLAIVNILPAVEFLPFSWFTLAAGVQVSLIGKNNPYAYTPTLAIFINF